MSCRRGPRPFRLMVKGPRTSDAIDQVVELDDLTVVLGNLPALVSRTELERASTTSTSRGSPIERGQNPTFRIRFLCARTVLSRGPPHRSLRQDWKRFLTSIGRYACATFEGPPPSRFRAGLLAPCASRVMPGRPLL